jgi:hypothetical protein
MNDDDTGSETESDGETNRWIDWQNHKGDA